MKWIRRLALLVALLAGGFAIVASAARFMDGPLGLFPGGPLEAGPLSSADSDWSFTAGIQEVELQLLTPPRSRTTWILEDAGSAYIPCGFLKKPLFKQWHRDAMKDGRAIVRIAGRRYAVALERATEIELEARLFEAMRGKYELPAAPHDRDDVWFFRLTPRSSESEGTS
jgi:hypothetical protein